VGASGAAGAPGAPGASGAAGRDPGGSPPPGLDVSTAHPARVWNYWLGGRDYFAADQAAGEQMNRDFPHLAQAARAERAFLVRAVRFLAGPARVRQFLDIGAGLPAGGNTHEIAQRIAPDARIVYADNDPAVLVHARALLRNPMLASTPGGAVSYVDADLRDVTAVLAGSARTLDLEKPVALIMLGVLGHIDDHGAARSITSQLMDALPAGSYLAMADGVAGSGPVENAQQRYNDAAPVPYHLRRPDELASFFDGLDLIEPGVVPCPRWKPDAPGGAGAPGAEGGAGAASSAPDEPAVYCGVARKP
jgi:O-methyltransferase involved in polyketide biosynthesis